MNDQNSFAPKNFQVPCPKCKTLCTFDKQKNPYRPFCSERCQTNDLGTWADEGYRIAAENTDLSQNLDEESDESEK
ncbi:MAG: DNA gyrase inhibitor YacG [Pseudobdellovibrionaceae bacterium]|jgi:endogenous inhibitor of DNA gyrase (YacG/DUF329 family)